MARCEQPLTERRRRRPWMPPACISASASPSTAPAILHAPELVKLPLWEMHDGRKHCYVVEGTKIGTRVAMEDGEFGGAEGPLKSAKRLPQKLRNRLQRLERSFWPDPKLVTPDYYIYCKWRFIQRIAASAISVIATQQMLFAVGLGAKRTLPTAAALNWVMKDGLGRLGKLSVATNFGREFDADLKRFRFTSSVVFNMSAAVETLTPLFPNQFLLLATAANIGKSIGITTANVVRAPIQRSFALGENLADISARTSAQQVIPEVLCKLHATLQARGVLFVSNPRGNNQEGYSDRDARYGAYWDEVQWRKMVGAAGFEELEHYYRPPGKPRNQQPWFVTVWRKVDL